MLIPQVAKSFFPGRERWGCVELVVYINVLIYQHRYIVQEIGVYLGDERGIDVTITKDTKSPFVSRGVSMT